MRKKYHVAMMRFYDLLYTATCKMKDYFCTKVVIHALEMKDDSEVDDMADKMEFPKTIAEFIKGYSFKDTEEVYTNGVELIPVFRVEQAIEHYEQEARAKAIDEFAKKLIINFSDWQMSLAEVGNEREYETIQQAIDGILEIAEQLKEGGK